MGDGHGQRWLYHPAQNGSASLKAVLPAFTNISYDDLEIGNGEQALQEYLAFVLGLKTDAKELKELWDGLEEYCKQDTYAMVELLKVIFDRAGITQSDLKRSSKPPSPS